MTQEEEDRINQMIQMDMMGQSEPTLTTGYGLYPAGDQSASVSSTLVTIPTPEVP